VRIRPEINELEAPKSYIDLMKRCWDQNSDNRPKVVECDQVLSSLLHNNKEQLDETEEYRISHNFSEKNRQSTHTQAIYMFRIINPFTKNLSKDYNIDSNIIEDTDDLSE
jgi:hypothetical protein